MWIMSACTSDFAVNPHVHSRHGLLRISVLWLAAAFFELVKEQKSATCNISRCRRDVISPSNSPAVGLCKQ